MSKQSCQESNLGLACLYLAHASVSCAASKSPVYLSYVILSVQLGMEPRLIEWWWMNASQLKLL